MSTETMTSQRRQGGPHPDSRFLVQTGEVRGAKRRTSPRSTGRLPSESMERARLAAGASSGERAWASPRSTRTVRGEHFEEANEGAQPAKY